MEEKSRENEGVEQLLQACLFQCVRVHIHAHTAVPTYLQSCFLRFQLLEVTCGLQTPNEELSELNNVCFNLHAVVSNRMQSRDILLCPRVSPSVSSPPSPALSSPLGHQMTVVVSGACVHLPLTVAQCSIAMPTSFTSLWLLTPPHHVGTFSSQTTTKRRVSTAQ